MKKKNILIWVLFFLIFFSIAQLFTKKSAPPTPVPGAKVESLTITPSKKEFATGEEVIMAIKNNTADQITIKSSCPKNPLRVLAWATDKFEERSVESKINCELSPDIVIKPDSETKVSYKYWNTALFGQIGRYKVEATFTPAAPTDSTKTVTQKTSEIYSSPEFTIAEAGFWRKTFRAALYQPIYNVLVLMISIAPGSDLGFAIILLTILIRLVLLIPSQHAIVSQRKMQELQPKLAEVRKKYAGNQERIAQETMALWKNHKVNPFSSCLPILVQFPVLIALFYVIQNGLNPDNINLVYGPLKNVDLTNVHTNFLGMLELTRMNTFVLPLIVGALQFAQLKLATAIKKKKDEKEPKTDDKKPGSEMDTANKMMTYVMPVMIAVFTASVPAGVGLYWGISTLFAIGQQVVANRKTIKPN
ncbi:MAG: YidC/Oxa1 family membrane protein insertase [Candidatus Gracilibacteria bacterium]